MVGEALTAERNDPGAATTTTMDSRWSRLGSPATAKADTAMTETHAETIVTTRQKTSGRLGDLANLETTIERPAHSTTNLKAPASSTCSRTTQATSSPITA